MANGVAASAYMFDTHAFVKQLMAAKFTEAQAETVCAVVQKSHESATSGFSTKQDILDLRKDMEGVKKDIIIKLTAVILGTVGLVLAAIKLLF